MHRSLVLVLAAMILSTSTGCITRTLWREGDTARSFPAEVGWKSAAVTTATVEVPLLIAAGAVLRSAKLSQVDRDPGARSSGPRSHSPYW